ncbi:MAG: LD-carboxypeptidase [bacterium]
MKHARALKPGDTIGIAAPSSPFDRNAFQKGVHALEKLGFKVSFRKDIFDQNRYFAGTDQRRAEEFTELMSDRSIAAVMFARGGYGSQRVIPLLNADALRQHAKPVLGFSDLTALLTFLRQGAGIPTFYSPVITQLGREPHSMTMESLAKALTTSGPLGPISSDGSHTMLPGEASGPLVGGCLSLINSSVGTPYELETTGSVLFIEEVGEKVYVIDRMLTQLKNSGAISKAVGIIFGSLKLPDGEKHDVDAMLADVLSDFTGPVVTNFPAGHSDEFVTLPLGAGVELSAPAGGEPRLTCTEGLLS